MKTKKSFCKKDVPTPFSLCGLPKDTGVILAYSGGADSTALLHLLSGQAKEYGFSLTLAHLNHGIRGDEADRDEAFCRETAKSYGLPILVERVDVPALAKEHKRGLEEEARMSRYAFFEDAMERANAKILATAHHADDNLETLLFRLARGTSLSGLGGIQPSRPFGSGYLVRPLLSFSKEELLALCKEENLSYVEDSTNAELSYARNLIRKNLAPGLKQLFDDPEHRAYRTAEWLREDEAYLSSLAEESGIDPTKTGLPLEELSALPKPLLRRILGRFAEAHTGKSPSGAHLESLLTMVERKTGKVELSGGNWAVAEGKKLKIYPPKEEPQADFPPFSEGEWITNGITVRVEAGAKLAHKQKNACVIAIDPAHPPVWRLRRPGETILLGKHHKQLRKCYREAGVSPYFRERMPLLCDDAGVAFAPYVGLRDGMNQNEKPQYTVRVSLPDEEI
ncbi:MAG: tRNA lysidine(34) synthetase TilS [Clostridia bacterium]|nr:tRNA lysidine(34) synthetase TilS [Clostridia bacterium]